MSTSPEQAATTLVTCPRCGKQTPIASDTIRSDQFCSGTFRDERCDFPLFFAARPGPELEDGDGATRWPADVAPAPAELPAPVRQPPPPSIPVRSPVNWAPPPPVAKRPTYWRLWPIVAVIAFVDAALIYLLITRLL